MERLPLFTFGTLRSGQCNHHLLRGRYEKRLQARLYGYSLVGPLMMAPEPGNCVLGELFIVSETQYDAVLADCDELEMLPPGELVGKWYARKQVTVSTQEGEQVAWAYVRSE